MEINPSVQLKKSTSKSNIIKNPPSHWKPCTYVWLKKYYLDEDDPWSGILPAKDFVVQSMYHTTMQANTGDLVFGRDMILNPPLIAEWEYIRLDKQNNNSRNNQPGKKDLKPHTYLILDKVLVRTKNKYIWGYVCRPLYNNPIMD